MRTTWKTMGLTVALAIGLAASPGLARADDVKAAPSPADVLKVLEEAGQPGPEHKKLEPFVGDWTLTMKMWTDPSQPPAEMKGTVQRKWIMGGRFVQESFVGECNGKSVEGLGLLGYHRGEKKYTTVRACGMCGTTTNSLSSLDATGKKFTCTTEESCPLTGEKVEGRDEVIIESKDKIVTNVYKTMDGREVKVMEIVSIRK